MKTIILFLTVSLSLDAAAKTVAEWPMTDWPRQSLQQAGFSPSRFKNFLAFAFAPGVASMDTDSILVVKNGYLVHEQYANGYRPDQKHALWSLGKTMINALMGVLEQRGILRRGDLLSQYYPAVGGQGRDITLEHLLHMSSGLSWIEEDKKNLLTSDPWFAFYTRESYVDMPGFVARRAVTSTPGSRFNYSSGDSGLLVAAMRGAIEKSVGLLGYENFAWVSLFDKLGMTSVAIERDQAGNQGLHGIGYASSLDIARMGLLYLRGGRVGSEQLWPADWVAYSARMAPSQLNPPLADDRNLQNNQAYGAQIWLNRRRPEDATLPYPELPENALLGLGTRGQILLVLPDEDLILVRTATDAELLIEPRKNFRRQLFGLLMESLVSRGGRP